VFVGVLTARYIARVFAFEEEMELRMQPQCCLSLMWVFLVYGAVLPGWEAMPLSQMRRRLYICHWPPPYGVQDCLCATCWEVEALVSGHNFKLSGKQHCATRQGALGVKILLVYNQPSIKL
jgi:hypothetical protein